MDSVTQTYSVYALIDPRNDQTRYVGMSKNPYQRFGQHLAMQKDNPAKYLWIQELADEELIPELAILESRIETKEKCEEREGHWIQHFLDEGTELLNVDLPKNVTSDVIYHKFVDIVFSLRGLTNVQFRLLLHIARSADQSRRSTCSIDLATLAEATECSERYVREVLRELEGLKLITSQSKGGGRGKATVYAITLPAELIARYKKTHKKKYLRAVGQEQDKIVENHFDQLTGTDDPF